MLDFQKDVKELIRIMPARLKEYHTVFSGNISAKNRLVGVGHLSKEDAINYDITSLLAIEGSIHSLVSTGEAAGQSPEPESIPLNVNDLLDELISQSIKLVGKPVAMMTKDDKVKAIQFLNNAGAFLVTKSGDKVSRQFGISKYTLYSYMDASKAE